MSQTEFFCPECLWKTFHYKKHANKIITALGDVQGIAHIKEEDVAKLQLLIDSKGSQQRSGKRPAAGPAARLCIEEEEEDAEWTPMSQFCPGRKVLVYDSFEIKEELKALGFMFNYEIKSWFRPLHDVLALSDDFRVAEDVTLERLLALARAQMAASPEEQQKQQKQRRRYIHCPFQDKEEAKGLGAKWDGEQQMWYQPSRHAPRTSAAPRWAVCMLACV